MSPSSSTACCGAIYFTAEKAAEHGKNKEKVILVRKETTPEDIEGMDFSQAILTAFGGMTSHAAVVARGMGRAAVVGCGDLKFNADETAVTINGKEYHEGDLISVDGSTGNVYDGLISTVGMGTSSQRALTPVSNDYTTTVLFNEGVFWPVITEDYLKSFFDYLSALAFWGNGE